MAAIPPLMNLQERKRALLTESELNRLVLQLEVENLKDAVASGGTLSRIGSRVGWLAPVLAMAGLFAGKKLGKAKPRPGLFKLALAVAPFALRLLRPRKSTRH